MYMYMFGCLVNGVCVVLQLYWLFGALQAFTGISLHLLTVNTHHYGNLQFYTMHLSVQFNHFNRAHWVAVRCEASRASDATPAVAEASEASGS